MPLFKAAGMVAALLLTGTVMQRSMDDGGGVVYVYDEYGDTATDPQVAYDPVLPMDTVAKRPKARAGRKERS